MLFKLLFELNDKVLKKKHSLISASLNSNFVKNFCYCFISKLHDIQIIFKVTVVEKVKLAFQSKKIYHRTFCANNFAISQTGTETKYM